MTDTESKIKEIIHGITHNDMELASSTLLKELKMDSLDIVQVIVAIEQEYDIEITDDAVVNFQSFGDVVSYVENKVKEKGR